MKNGISIGNIGPLSYLTCPTAAICENNWNKELGMQLKNQYLIYTYPGFWLPPMVQMSVPLTKTAQNLQHAIGKDLVVGNQISLATSY
jgi:hypothetical protein